MKKKFSKILGVGLTLSLLVSLLLTAAPVAADISQPMVGVDPDEISDAGKYTITFSITEELAIAGVGGPDYIEVRFPDDTDVGDFDSTVYTPATVYVLGDLVHKTGTFNGVTYKCTTAVGSAQIEPTWAVPPVIGTEELALGVGWTPVTKITIAATSGIGSASFIAKVPVAAATVDTDALTVKFDLPAAGFNGTNTIGIMASVQVVLEGVVNPTEPGIYTLEVRTEEEDDYVESESYDIDAPTVGGFVYVYNPSNILMATFGGSNALNDAQGTPDYYSKEDFTLKVGEGTYVLSDDIAISGKNVTLESSEGAADTIIDADDGLKWSIIITGEDVIIDGFTIDDAPEAIIIQNDDATVTNCVITDANAAGIQIDIGGTDATVSDNVIEDCARGILFAAIAATDMLDVDISGNTITEANTLGGIVFGGGNQNIDITGNTITGNECSGIYFDDGNLCKNILIEGNTISANEAHGIHIVNTTAPPTELAIRENNILDNEADGIFIFGDTSWNADTDYIMFNNIHGSTDANIDNDDTNSAVNARFNWWGTAVEADFEDELEGLVDADYEPFLMSTWETAVSGSKVAVADKTSLDAKDAAGVKVSGVDDGLTREADIISAAKYVSNPEGALDDAIAFYDVFVLLETNFVLTDVIAKLKFYDSAITTGSVANFWTGDFWAECSDQEARDGIIYVTVSDDTLPALDELEETIFAVVAGEAVTEFGAPTLLAPAVGSDDVSLTPTFAWGAIPGAIGYDFEMADNTLFVMPMVSLTGELGRLIVTAYAYVGELPYSTAYYWRVKAVSATEESDWASSVFITMDEPVEPIPPVVIEPYEPPEIIIEQPDIIVESPDVIVPLPAETPITPAWIYVIIGVGAVLVIALLVLIVRTRRVA